MNINNLQNNVGFSKMYSSLALVFPEMEPRFLRPQPKDKYHKL